MELTKTKFKQTEIGLIPEDWDLKYIDDVVKISTGSKNTQDKISDGKYPFYVRSQTVERINSFSYDCEAVLTVGDGVGTGKVFHYVNEKFELHQRVYIMNDFAEDLHGYYFYLFFSNNFYGRVMQMTAKSSVDSVRREMIAGMKIPLPPLPEQKAIAKVLSDTDNLIQVVEQKLTKKRAIKQGAMQQLLTPKDDWEVKKLGEIGDIITGSTPSTKIQEYWNGNIPWITPTDISNKSRDILSSEREITQSGLKATRKLPVNTLLVTCIASIGKNAILRKAGACNQQINAIIPFEDNNVDFLYYLIENSKKLILSKAGITATLMVSKKVFSEIEFAIPSPEEQIEIATILSDMDAEIEQLEQKLSKYKLLKQGLMQNLLTGKIRLV